MKLELVRWKIKNGRGWREFHLTANGTNTLCGKEIRSEFGRRSINPFHPDDLVTCATCRRMYESQQEFRDR